MDKELIVKHVKQQLSDEALAELPDSRWWYTGKMRGLRLTNLGNDAFRQADIESFEVPYTKTTIEKMGSWTVFILTLSRKITCPYYITADSIVLYDIKIASMINLYGSVEDYLHCVTV